MALVLVLEKTSITSNCTTIVCTDITGNYSATNLTGYGAPNETRANLYLKFLTNLRKSTGREPITITAYNENTVTSWSFAITESGWYEHYLFGCKVWSAVISYAIGEIVYDVATDAFYKSVTAANLNNAVTNATYWTATVDVVDFTAAVALPQADVYQVTLNKVETCELRKCEGQMLLKAKCDCCDECTLQEYEKVRMKLEAIVYQESLGNYTEAEEIVEDLLVVCENLEDCGCNK